MAILGGVGGAVACFALLFVLFFVAIVIWYWRRQPEQQVSATPPTPPIQETIQHPTAAADLSAPAQPTKSGEPTTPSETPPDA